MFLFVLSYVAGYFYFIDRYKASFIAMLPAFLIYFLVAGLQYNVGSDYYSYVDIFTNEEKLQLYFERGEVLFYWVVSLLQWLELPPQSIFLAISFVQSLLIFIYLKSIKKLGFFLPLFFIVFFCVSNIYNNQLNGLRQYVVVTALPILTILLHNRRYFYFYIGVFVVSLFHNTAWFLLILVPLYIFHKKADRSLFFLFCGSVFGYLFLGSVIYDLVEMLLPSYAHYLHSEYSKGESLVLFATKLVYLPLIFYFYAVYRKDNSDFGRYFHFVIFVFTLTYWFFILALYLGLAVRFYYYFAFFLVFPFYYILHQSYKSRQWLMFAFVLFYAVFPYVAKVTVFAKAEFFYQSIVLVSL